MKTLASGFGLVEGPREDGKGGVLFSDVTGGGVYRAEPEGRIETMLPKRRGIGGLLLHADGGVVASGRDVIRFRKRGKTRVLLDSGAPGASGVTGFNDMTTAPDGSVIAGALRFHPLQGGDPVEGQLWRIPPEGGPHVICEGITWPNGIGISPDGRTLYAADYHEGEVLAWDLDEDWRASNRRVFAPSPRGTADGLALDAEGHVWIALGAGGGVARLSPVGELDRIVEIPSGFVSSVSFGGGDAPTMYVTTADRTDEPELGGCLLELPAEVAGLEVRPAVP